MNYAEISQLTMANIYKAYESLKESPVDKSLRALLELRVSQINRCFYCCNIHISDARKHNISQKKIDLLPIWSATSGIFTEKEMIVLRWCEYITTGLFENLIGLKDQMKKHFSEKEISDLSICIALMNALNRIAITLKNF
jgi:AhpD family alkylhydroperoxidase